MDEERNREMMNNRRYMVIAQILVLVVAMFSYSYLISSFIGSVSALELDVGEYACCEQTNSGNSCQYSQKDNCDSDYKISPNECSESSFCELGCCQNSIGICMENSANSVCDNGQYYDDANCNVNSCTRGCCVLGSEGLFTTEQNCEFESASKGYPTDFRGEVNSEVACIFLTQKDEMGACLLDNDIRDCVYTNREDCLIRSGGDSNFYGGTYCSNPDLETNCLAQNYTSCNEGEDSVYWYDSCGNAEGVKESCSIFLGNICGQYRPGVDIEPDTGDYVCRSLDCSVELYGKTIKKKNGESWCEYEGSIGEGRDTVGSRHIRHICFLGEEKIEACGDYRNQICVQDDSDIGGGEVFSDASCRVNRWRSCYEYNTRDKTDMDEACAENPDCFIKSVNAADNFNFDMCVPNYPPGFDFASNIPARNGEFECSLANQQCVVTYVKELFGWKCESNCECENAGFATEMNNFCTALGDCGAYANYNGDVTDDGYTVSGSAGLSSGFLDEYSSLATDKPGQEYANPGDFSFGQILGLPVVGGLDAADSGLVEAGIQLGLGWAAKKMMKDGSAVSAVSSAIPSANTYYNDLLSHAYEQGFTPGDVIALDLTGSFDSALVEFTPDGGQWIRPIDGEWADLTSGQGITLTPEGGIDTAGSEVTKKGFNLKMPQWAGDALSVAGAILSIESFLSAGFGIKDDATSYGIASALALGIFFEIGPLAYLSLFWVGIGLTIISFAIGLGKSKSKVVTFGCYPWQAPQGGDKCEVCNERPEICSEYKCSSLGQTCELINARTVDQKCFDNDPNDVGSPKISPLLEVISDGYNYNSISNSGFSINADGGSCIPEYTTVDIGIELDRPGQCKIGVDLFEDYNSMPEYFGGRNLYLDNHTMQLLMPSISAFKFHYNLTQEQIESLGEVRYYVKCKSFNGNSNVIPFVINSCVNPGPDLTAPRITKVDPERIYVGFDDVKKDLQIWINEPSSCKYSYVDQAYDSMENDFNCKTDLVDYGIFGWECKGELTGFENNSEVYIRCLDQPFEELENRNVMTQSYIYNLFLSEDRLIISDFKPDEGFEFIFGYEPVSFDFKVQTTGGIDNGKSKCEWFGNGYSDSFASQDSNIHTYSVTSGTRGKYEIKFKCEDKAGNIATANTTFNIKIDDVGPKINRMYYDGGLTVETDEKGECRYSFNKMDSFENKTTMSGDGLTHSANWELRKYYIQCQDDFLNKGGKIEVEAVELLRSN